MEENKINEEKYVDLDEKWRKKLQIKVKIPKEFLYITELNQTVLEEFKIFVDITTVLVYVEKMRKGTNFTVANRHNFLNNQILLFHKICEKKIKEFDLDVENIKKKMDTIDYWSRNKDKMKKDSNNKALYQFYTRKYKGEMCNTLLKEGKCNDGYLECKFAHNPCQLNLVLAEQEKKMLMNTQRAIIRRKRHCKPVVPWRPGRRGFIEKMRGRGRIKPPKKLKREGVVAKFLDSVLTDKSKEKDKRSKSAKRAFSKDPNQISLNFHEI